jgi:hypothetical protein
VALRFDTQTVEDAKIQRTPSGGVRVDAMLTRPGVYKYDGPDGKPVLEYRPPEEVFHADSLASLNDAAVTIRHPRVPVTANNWRQLSIGHVTGARKDDSGRGATAKVIVSDAPAVARVGSDLREVSCGYEVRLDMTPGVTPEGERYDCVQRDIRYNHVGLGPSGWGRQGPQSALRLDSAGDQAFEDEAPSQQEIKTMKIKLDGIEFEAATETELQAKIDAHNASKTATADKARADELAGENTVLKAQLADAVKRADSAPVAATTAVRARIELEAAAGKVLGAAYKFDAADGTPKSAREIHLDAIKTFDPTFKADNETDDFVRGVFAQWSNSPIAARAKQDALLAGTAPTYQAAPLAQGGGLIKNDGLDRQNPSADAARNKMNSGLASAATRPGDLHK